jgi:benzil reductase ((S)-benzoin forming)
MKYFIITGASSGLGEALAKEVITSQHKIFCISRNINHHLKDLASENRTGFWYFEQNLTDVSRIPDLVKEIFTYIDNTAVSEIVLINNAGVVEPVKPLGKCNVDELVNSIQINLTAPIVLINEFIKNSLSLNCLKTVVNISSGAAFNPYFGWAAYCSSKAGIDMITRTVGLENDFNNVRIMSIAPGVVDTSMQTRLRDVDEADFPMKQKFVRLFEEERLTKPKTAAVKILNIIDNPPVTGSITDLRKIEQ